MKRAVQAQDKARRREAILEAGRALCSERAYEGTSMAAIADRAGLAKGTVFLYFPTREALFLALFEVEADAFFRELQRQLAESESMDADRLTGVLVSALWGRDPLLELLGRLHLLLEANVDLETGRAFKHRLKRQMERTARQIRRVLGLGTTDEAMSLLMRLQALCIGVLHQARPSPVMAEVLADPKLAVFRVDFADEFRNAAVRLVRGTVAAARPKEET